MGRGLPRRKVIGSEHLKTGRNVGRQKVWAYVVEDLAALFGMTPDAVRKAIQRGRFDPSNLRSIYEFMVKKIQVPEEESEEEAKE